MAPADPPKDDRVGNDYHEGNNPGPGGDIDTGDSALPPYEGRTKERGEAKGTARAWGSEPPVKEPAQPGSDEVHDESDMPPEGVGESTTKSGEDVKKDEGKESGRVDTGTDEAGRPTGESTGEDATDVGPPKKSTGRTP